MARSVGVRRGGRHACAYIELAIAKHALISAAFPELEPAHAQLVVGAPRVPFCWLVLRKSLARQALFD